MPLRAALLKGMYYLAEPLVQWRQHAQNWTDSVSDKTGTNLVFGETHAAFDVTGMICMLEDLAQFRDGRRDDARLTAAHRKLVGRILLATQTWTRYRTALLRDGQRPTWADKAEFEGRPVKKFRRLQPDVRAADAQDGGTDGT